MTSWRGYLYEMATLQLMHLPFWIKKPNSGIKFIKEIFFLHSGQWDLGVNKLCLVSVNSIKINLYMTTELKLPIERNATIRKNKMINSMNIQIWK